MHIESVNSHGQTPLFCASFGGDNEVVALLLKLGANPNRRCGTNGSTPVHGAAYRGSRRVLRLLVEAGGDLSLEDNLEQTPRRGEGGKGRGAGRGVSGEEGEYTSGVWAFGEVSDKYRNEFERTKDLDSGMYKRSKIKI